MLKARQCLLGIRTFLGVTSGIWGFIMYILRKHLRTIIQYQTVRYDTLPLSPIPRLNAVKRKILVLDLDETLIHSHHDGVLRPGTPADFILEVVIDKHPVRVFVDKRPHVDFFLELVSQWYELVVFTASMEIYGSAVADKLDNNRNVLKRRYYRQHCTFNFGSYIKDLSVVHNDLSSIIILDNSPGAYRSHPDNAIPIKSWFSDPSDTALLNLLPMLDALRFTADVRSVLSRNLHQHQLWMLVGYSSSSEEDNLEETAPNKDGSPTCEEEEKGEDGYPVRKKPRAEPQVTKTRLPVPVSIMSMFPNDGDQETENSSLHAGRIRSFRHERGNWATYVYLPNHPEEEFEEVLEELFSAVSDGGVDLTRQEEFHLSLSQTVVLRHHWLQPFTQSLRADLARCKKFVCSARKLKVYCNAEKTRTFLGIEVCSGQTQLLDVVRVVDRTMTKFRLDTFYKEPSFHVSLAWCVGDMREKMDECIQKLQCVVDEREEGPFHLRLDCVELHCRTGNKTFRFPLEP